jgi:hypothetical protein
MAVSVGAGGVGEGVSLGGGGGAVKVGVALGVGEIAFTVAVAVGEAVPVDVKIYVNVGSRVGVSVAGSVIRGAVVVRLAVAVGRDSPPPPSTRFTIRRPMQ